MDSGEPVARQASWVEFGHRLRALRRQAGLTQLQLGLRLGYHNSLISKLEKGLREPQSGVARRLDDLLGSNGELAAIVAAPNTYHQGRPQRPPLEGAYFSPIPGGGANDAVTPLNVRGWPTRLPDGGIACPLHGSVGCSVPSPGDVLAMLASINRTLPSTADPDVMHGLTALLAGCEKASAHNVSTEIVGSVERALHLVVRWAETVNSAGKVPRVQLWLAANYAQIAGRLRTQRGQCAIGMAWFAHGLRWAEVSENAVVRVTLLTDMCMLAHFDRDTATSLSYAKALGAVDPRRGWVSCLSHLYQARAHALDGQVVECRRHIAIARRKQSQLDERDQIEAPWLVGADGHLRVEAGVGGALRDLAALTGDRRTARQAVHATQRALSLLPALMRPANLMLTLRLADAYACAREPDAAVATAAPVVLDSVLAQRLSINHELRGLHTRLSGRWADLPAVRDLSERLLDTGA